MERIIAKMEILDVILEEVKHIRKEVNGTRQELKEHIKEESDEFAAIKRDIHGLTVQQELRKQESGYISAFISMVVAAVVSWFAIYFGGRGQ